MPARMLAWAHSMKPFQAKLEIDCVAALVFRQSASVTHSDRSVEVPGRSTQVVAMGRGSLR